jgi:hypothetical protein
MALGMPSRALPLVHHRMIRPLVLTLAFCATACSSSNIPNTDVEDTSQNRRIISFCEQYRHAVEEKNIGQLMKMVHPRYHEDGGNTNNEDDLDFDGLRGYLNDTFMKTQQIRYEIRYRKVTLTETNHVYVDYTYAASYKIPGAKLETTSTEPKFEWRHVVQDNRLDLVPDGDTYKIIAGM